ncbi:hypothetical protein KC906_03310 [Candidatus Kaiserbacteria bacterium]|nr:hypothetical protein [Candidatus Kaiserbacteria bacterium]
MKNLILALVFSTFATYATAQVAAYWHCDNALSGTIVSPGVAGCQSLTSVGVFHGGYGTTCDPGGCAWWNTWPILSGMDPGYYVEFGVFLAQDMVFQSIEWTQYRSSTGPVETELWWSGNSYSSSIDYSITTVAGFCDARSVNLVNTVVTAGNWVRFRFYGGSAISSTGRWFLDDVRVNAILATTLPVELVSFDAERGASATSMVDLTWVTASEDDCSHFTVERSLDRLDWSVVSTVVGAGNSQEEIEYKLVDFQAPQELVYYRLTQHDLNGDFRVYDDKVVAVSPVRSVLIFPNPATVGQEVSVPPDAIITDQLGRQVQFGRSTLVPQHTGVYHVGEQTLLVR